MCALFMASLIAEEGKVLSSCHPPTSVALISHKQMKSKHAAGVLGECGALTDPAGGRGDWV